MEVNRLINYLDANDNAVMKHLVNSFLIRNEDDLNILKDAECPPGTQAYLADESKVWELDANYEWQLKGGNSEGNDSNADDIMVVKAPLFIERDAYVCDKTWIEIYNALEAKIPVMIIEEDEDDGFSYFISSVLSTAKNGTITPIFYVHTDSDNANTWSADAMDDYPVRSAVM